MTTFKQTSREVVNDLGFLKLMKNNLIEETTNTEFDRYCLDHIGACAVLPVMKNGDVVLIQQYRSALNREIVEVVAGKLDIEGEDLVECCKRELLEEVGVVARKFIQLGSWEVSPGWTDEIEHGFLALDCDEPVETQPDGIEEKFSTVIRISLDEAMNYIEQGIISDAISTLVIERAYKYLASN